MGFGSDGFFHWNVNPEIFVLWGTYGPRWYGLCFAACMFIGYLVAKHFFKEAGRSEDELNSGFVLFVAGTIIGARLGHCLFYEPEFYLSHPLQILYIWQGGLASHGGTLGVIAAMVYFTRKHSIPFLWLVDRLSIAITLGVPFIRIGNFFNSEIIGRESDLPWAVVFDRVDAIPRHPAQLYEALCYFILAGFLILYYRINKARLIPGRMIGIMFIGIFSSRIAIEFFKENQESFENDLVLNMGQLLSIPMILLGLIFLLRKPTPPPTGATART